MPKAYFISDAHLGLGTRNEEREKERRLIAFLDFASQDADQLFIVGDLFDAWIEYRTVIPKGFHRLLTKLEDFTRRGAEVHYLAGNHDYWMRDYFQDELGIKTYSDAFQITIDGKRVFIHHGDGLSPNDMGYKILKRILRNRFNIWLYSWFHPDLAIPLARSTSKRSRHYTSQKDYGEEDSMLKFAQTRIQEGNDVVVMGHRHQPTCKEIGGGIYLNLGDWITHNTYALMENGRIDLKKWEN